MEDDDIGRTDDPVRMYLKEMGNVELCQELGNSYSKENRGG